jgi:hypothetical protein
VNLIGLSRRKLEASPAILACGIVRCVVLHTAHGGVIVPCVVKLYM